MPLQTNAVMTFVGYEMDKCQGLLAAPGLYLHFVCANPGPGEVSDYYVIVTDAELAGISTQAALRTLVITKLQRAYRASGIASKLDQFIGQSVTI